MKRMASIFSVEQNPEDGGGETVKCNTEDGTVTFFRNFCNHLQDHKVS
jgi:hypothetical protein